MIPTDLPELARVLMPLGLDEVVVVPGDDKTRVAMAAIEARMNQLLRELADTRRSYQYAADALTRANRRLREERDRLEFRVSERTAQLEASRAELLEAQRLAALGNWTLRRDTSTLELSEWLAQRLGLEDRLQDADCETLLARVAPVDHTVARRALRLACAAPRRLSGELRLLDRQGAVRWYAATIDSRADEDGRVMRLRGVLHDVTDRRAATEAVAQQARQDDLTGLPNRAAFREDLYEAIARARGRKARFALLFIDLDGFKEINDSLGHDLGDALLKAVASRMRRCLRTSDRLGRFGGDEFLVLLDPVRRLRDVEAATRKLLEAVARPVMLDGLSASVSASIGIALFPEHGEEPRRLLRNADAAMYQAKRDGRNRMQVYEPQINACLRSKLALITDLRTAVAQSALEVVYQPILEGESGRIMGVEALSRWTHPMRGTVSPSEFIPLAEECGLIGTLGTQVLVQGCAQMRVWEAGPEAVSEHSSRLRPYLSVNVSPVQLRDPAFTTQLASLLSQHGLAATRLQIEITEGTVMADPQRAAHTLHALSALGVRIALDDFGTGYSSLAYLRSFPIHCIKIARCFVTHLGQGDPAQREIVSAILAIARSLGASVVAEGVETAAERTALLELGCEGMQGYFFDRPLSAADCGARLRTGVAGSMPS